MLRIALIFSLVMWSLVGCANTKEAPKPAANVVDFSKSPVPADFKQFTHASFSIKYPSDWTANPGRVNVIFKPNVADKAAPAVDVGILNVQSLKLHEVAEEFAKENAGATTLSSEVGRFGEYAAEYDIYAVKSDGRDTRLGVLVIQAPSACYYIRFQSPAEMWDATLATARGMMGSLRFVASALF
jgi:hypothetical protein